MDPRNILLLTFTNKAANEMMERASKLVNSPLSKQLWGGTFHKIANKMLRLHDNLIGFRTDFSILDSDDAKKLCKNMY